MLGVTVITTTTSVYGLGSGPIFVSNLGCSGTEATLLECSHIALSLEYCTHDRDVGVRCEGIHVKYNIQN